jgi:hypothetical protein
MNCTECKKLLVEYTENLLDASQTRNIADHLKQCSVCREEAEAIHTLQARLVNDSQATGQTHLEDNVQNQILREQNSRLRSVKPSFFIPDIRSLIMKKSILRIVAVAVVIVGIFIGLNSLQNKVTYARVIDPVLNARTLIYDVVDPTDLLSFHDIVIERKTRRNVPFMNMEMIIDGNNSRILALDPIHKNASFGSMSQESFDYQRDFLNLIRDVIGKAVNEPQPAVNKLNQRTIDGRDVVGFKFNPEPDETAVNIWADPATALPVQIEIHIGKSYTKTLAGQNFTLKNIVVAVPVDESLVSMELPSGYTLKESQAFSLELYEDDFLKMLKMWTKYSPDRAFPDELRYVDPIKIVENSNDRMNLSPQEENAIGILYMRWGGFLGALGNNEADHLYSGKGVRYGETNTEISRYRMPDTQSWRVVYGDLHIDTIQTENPAR